MPGPGGEQVGEAHVDIHVNSAPGEAELAAFKAKVDRDFAELDRKRAEAKLSLKSAEFDAKIQKAKGELDNLEHRKARASVELDKAKFTAEIAEAKAEIKALGREKAVVNVDLKQLRAANREARLLSKGRALDERAALQQAKAEQRLAVERDKSITRSIKERAELAKLGAQYEKLRGKQIALEKSSRGVFSTRSIATAEREARTLRRVSDAADYVKHRIEKLGGSVADLDPEIQRNHTLWGRWLSRLGDTSIRIGPITTSVKGLGVGLGLLGPLIFELGGGLTALAGTVGEGLAGAFTVGAGALAGFSLAAAGIGFVIGPMVGEFKEVKSASEAVHKAMLKYGKGSDEVKTAQEKLNNELKGVSPIAREAFQSYGGLTSRWKALTKAARPAVFNAFGESLKTVQSLLPSFANESVKTTQVASKAWSGWMKSLRSSEAKSLLKSIMADFRASIPGLADGIGSLVAMMGRLSAAGAHFLPGLSRGFAEWADNLERAVGGGKDLQSDVGGLVDQMRDLGHLTQDTGSLLVHIFDAGSESGQGMVKSLDQVIQRWDKWTQTASGKRGLNEFFDDSKIATEDFMSSLSHLTRLLFEFSRATAPVANGLLKVVTFIGDLVSAADDIVGVKQAFQGIGIALAGLWATSKVMAFAGAIQGVTRALYGLAAGEAAVSAAQASGGIGSLLFGRGGARKATTVAETGEDALKSARQLTLFGAAAGTAEAATIGLEGSAGALAAALAPEILIPAAVVAGLVGLGIVLNEDSRGVRDMREEFKQAGVQIAAAMKESSQHIDQYVASQHRAVKANQEATAARRRLVQLQKENAPTDKVTRAVEELRAAETKQIETARRSSVINRQQMQDQHKLADGAKDRVRSAEEEIKSLKKSISLEQRKQGLHGGTRLAAFEDELSAARRRLAAATDDVGAALKREAVTAIPYERQLKNLKPITQAAEQGLRKLLSTIGATGARKIGRFVDPKDVQRATELGNKLTKLGRGGEVKNIAVKSQGAEQTISKLQRLQKQTNRVESARATIKVGANDAQAQSKLKRLSALSQKVSGTRNTVHILANSSSAENAIQRLQQNLRRVAGKKYQAELSAVDNGSRVAHGFTANARAAAKARYVARIEAVDNASSKAKTAKSNADAAGRTKPKINITATNAQALGAINAVQASLAGLHDKTVNVNVVTHKSGGFAGGHSAAYYSTFASGGVNDREIQRANEKAVTQRSGPSFRVNRPTMLVGEQAPSHPEYVIATNPAYQTDNERYLEDAAGEFGYELVPAYKKGKGTSTKKTAAAGESAEEKRRKMLARKPKGKKEGAGKQNNPPVFPGTGRLYDASKINTEKNRIEVIEEDYAQTLAHDEAEIRAGRMEAWEWAKLRGFQESERVARAQIQGPLTKDAPHEVTANEKKSRNYLTNGPGSRKALTTLRGRAKADKKRYSRISRDDYADNDKGDDAYRKDKRQAKEVSERSAEELQRVEREADRAAKMLKTAKAARSELTKGRAEQRIPLEANKDDLQYLTDVETGVVDTPYGESAENLIEESNEFKRAKAGLVDAELIGSVAGEEAARKRMIEITEREYAEAKQTASPEDDIDIGERLKQLHEEALTNGGKGTIGEQTASYNEARAQLYAQFASNIMGQLTPTAAPGVPAVGASGGTPSYAPGGAVSKLAAATPALRAGSTSAPGGGKIEVVNNFAAPPPDPHTWTRQQEFELGALV